MRQSDQHIREKILKHQSQVDADQLWMHIQERSKKRKRRFFFFWFLAGIMSVGIIGWIVVSDHHKKQLSVELERTEFLISEKISDVDEECPKVQRVQLQTSDLPALSTNTSDMNVDIGTQNVRTDDYHQKTSQKDIQHNEDPSRNLNPSTIIGIQKKEVYKNEKAQRHTIHSIAALSSQNVPDNNDAAMAVLHHTENKTNASDNITSEKANHVTDIQSISTSQAETISSTKVKPEEKTKSQTEVNLTPDVNSKDNLSADAKLTLIPAEEQPQRPPRPARKKDIEFYSSLMNVTRDCRIVGDSLSRNYTFIVPKYAGQLGLNVIRPWRYGLGIELGLRYTYFLLQSAYHRYEYRNDSIAKGHSYDYVFLNGLSEKRLEDLFYRRVTHIADIHYQRMHQMDLRAGFNVSKTMGRFQLKAAVGIAANLITLTSGAYLDPYGSPVDFSTQIRRNSGLSLDAAVKLAYVWRDLQSLGLGWSGVQYLNNFNRNALVKEKYVLSGLQLTYQRRW
ncbi:MAG: hypothetical protein K1X68_11370 [Saprospiraceae bacterium]|nr:hypothetical protein [Saprospiraceae bacterium]HMW39183.1 hypothetical protein [Saprospiraceae bacterium]HMX89283.1 hypothetical protein [Saprospiraceae bacterium]HMZ40613.1 hypothetical protein [Saprospiraceae bacterium]HNA63703.1 hypothetical protein [Saprospiraceae bacterium]